GGPVDSAVVYPVRVGKERHQVAPVLAYLAENRRSPRPLMLAGIDAQPGTSAFAPVLLAGLDRHLASVGLADHPAVGAFRDRVNYLFADGRRLRSMTADSLAELVKTGAALRTLLEPNRADAPELLQRGPFWARAVDNTVGIIRFFREADPSKPDPSVFNRRDSMMADNLLWLADGPFADRKIIIWGATSHLVRTRDPLQQDPAPEMIPAGQRIADALGAQVVSVGFTSRGGRTGLPYQGRMGEPRPLSDASSNTLESLIMRAGVKHAAFDLRDRAPDAAWLRRPWAARMLGHLELVADWTQMVDVLVYLDLMAPSLRRQ
ncbi:MAG: erythromycin esterase family protein, partial [Gemmatimonadales bacterium]